jgi:hypothetical protein
MSKISEILKPMVVDSKAVNFQFYRDGELWYETECGFQFPVPVSDTGKGMFKNKDKALLFMRWIRPQIAAIEAEKQLIADARSGK